MIMTKISSFFFALAHFCDVVSQGLNFTGLRILGLRRNYLHKPNEKNFFGKYTEFSFSGYKNGSIDLVENDIFIFKTKKVMWGYGFPLDDFNPHILECRFDGFLDTFYSNFCPQTFAQAWNPSLINENNYEPNAMEMDIPIKWLMDPNSEKTLPTADLGKTGHHQNSQFRGPLSQKNINIEKIRLKKIKKSILKEGYLPEKFGHITGTLFEFKGDYLVMLTGGNHRACALVDLNFEEVPIQISNIITTTMFEGSNYEESISKKEYEYLLASIFSSKLQQARKNFINMCFKKYLDKISQ